MLLTTDETCSNVSSFLTKLVTTRLNGPRRSARSPNPSLAFDLLDPGCCNTMGIDHNMCLPRLGNIRQIVLEIYRQKGFLRPTLASCDIDL